MSATVSFGGLDEMRGFLRSPRALMERIGAQLAARTQESFERGGHAWRGGKQWRPRRVPNVPGILADMATGAALKPRRMQAQPVLVDTGRLRQSVAHRVTGDLSVEYGTDVGYAAEHQLGRHSALPITRTMRSNLARLLKRHPELRPRLGPMFNRSILFTRLPERPIVVYERRDTAAVQGVIDGFVRDVLR